MSGKMNFYEHQSSFNPNMPVRMLIYSATVYDKYIKRNKLNVYGTAQLELPAPKFACFYNGTKAMKDKIVLKLSDSFENESRPDINLKVTMYNINHGQNKKLMNACRPLKDYAEFVNYVREYSESPDDLAESISKAIDSLPDDSVIKPVLEESRAEVINLCITEYTQEYADKIQKKEIDEYKETISVLKDDNANLKSENACLKNDIIEKDTEIATLKALLESKQIKY